MLQVVLLNLGLALGLAKFAIDGETVRSTSGVVVEDFFI